MNDLYSIYIDGRLDPRTELYDFKIERSSTGVANYGQWIKSAYGLFSSSSQAKNGF